MHEIIFSIASIDSIQKAKTNYSTFMRLSQGQKVPFSEPMQL